MNPLQNIIYQIELHSPEGIIQGFQAGVNPNEAYNGMPLIYELIGEYTRGPKFKECVRAFSDHGLQLPDKALLAVLLDDADALKKCLTAEAECINSRYTMPCAYTPFREVSLLHICAEFNHFRCAEILVHYGLWVDCTAGTDADGFG